jgi:thiamine kinase-like enzyme
LESKPKLRERVLLRLEEIVETTFRTADIEVAQSHGDFQPGNIFVSPPNQVQLIDWEYSKRRWRYYDLFSLAFQIRRDADSASLIRNFLCSGNLRANLRRLLPGKEAQSVHWRRAAVALFILNELEWALEDLQLAGSAAQSPNLERILSLMMHDLS